MQGNRLHLHFICVMTEDSEMGKTGLQKAAEKHLGFEMLSKPPTGWGLGMGGRFPLHCPLLVVIFLPAKGQHKQDAAICWRPRREELPKQMGAPHIKKKMCLFRNSHDFVFL